MNICLPYPFCLRLSLILDLPEADVPFRILLSTPIEETKRIRPARLLITRGALISLPLCYVSGLTTWGVRLTA